MVKVTQTVPLLLVTDIERSRDFYCGGLGFRTASEWRPEGHLAWCWLDHGAGGASIMVQKHGDEDPPPSAWGKGVTLYFLCEDAEAAYHAFADRGIEATEPAETFYGMNQVFVTDPDGYMLCFENRVEGIWQGP